MMLRWLFDEPGKIVRVKSWIPWWGPFGVEWPVLLVDRHGQRMTTVPVWGRNRFAELWRRATKRKT